MPCRLGRGQHGDTPVMKLCHTVGELAGQLTAGQMYILKRRCRITMPSERGNGMQFPARMGKVGFLYSKVRKATWPCLEKP